MWGAFLRGYLCAVFPEHHHIFNLAAANPAELFDREHGNVFIMFEAAQRMIVNAVLYQVIGCISVFLHIGGQGGCDQSKDATSHCG